MARSVTVNLAKPGSSGKSLYQAAGLSVIKQREESAQKILSSCKREEQLGSLGKNDQVMPEEQTKEDVAPSDK